MKTIKFMIAAILAGAISSCADTESSPKKVVQSVDAKGNCSEELIDSYNHLFEEYDKLDKLNKDEDDKVQLQSLVVKKACDDFFKYHDNVTCNGIQISKETTNVGNIKLNLDKKEESIFKSKEIKPFCEDLNKYLEKKAKTNQKTYSSSQY